MSEQGSEQGIEATPEPNEAPAQADWKQSLPEYAQGWDEVKNAESFDDFISWADNARSLVGQSVRIPGEDAGPEQWDAFSSKLLEKNANVMVKPRNAEEQAAALRALGRPDEAAAYHFEVEGFDADPDRLESFKRVAHEANLTEGQFTDFMSAMANLEVNASQSIMEMKSETMTDLRQEWGAAFDQNKESVASLLARTKAPEAFAEAERRGELEGDYYKWLHDLSKRFGGEGSPGAATTGENYVMTPADAKSKISEIRENKDHPFHRGDNDAIEQMINLQRMASVGRR